MKLSWKSACENLDALCMPFAVSLLRLTLQLSLRSLIVAAIIIAFLYLHASDVHQHTFKRSRVQNLRAYKT